MIIRYLDPLGGSMVGVSLKSWKSQVDILAPLYNVSEN